MPLRRRAPLRHQMAYGGRAWSIDDTGAEISVAPVNPTELEYQRVCPAGGMNLTLYMSPDTAVDGTFSVYWPLEPVIAFCGVLQPQEVYAET